MSRPLAVLVRGHAPGHGASHGAWSEYDTLPEYMIAAELRLRAEGVDVIRLELGTLGDRQRRGLQAIEYHRKAHPGQPCLYVSCHMNAGGGTDQRSELYHDHRSAGGARACQAIARALGTEYDWRILTFAARAEGWLARPFNCISAMYATTPSNCCAVLIELASVDREPLDIGLLRRGGAQLGAGLAAHLHSEPTA